MAFQASQIGCIKSKMEYNLGFLFLAFLAKSKHTFYCFLFIFFLLVAMDWEFLPEVIQ